jgi:hypothetical protein
MNATVLMLLICEIRCVPTSLMVLHRHSACSRSCTLTSTMRLVGPGRIVKNEASALGGKRKYVRRAGPAPGRRKQHNSVSPLAALRMCCV